MRRLFDAGRLRHRAHLDAPTTLPDESGGAETVWSEVASLSVHVEAVSVTGGERFDRREETATHRIVCRHRSDVSRGMRLRLGTRLFRILTVHDPEEAGRVLVLACEEER